MFSVVYSHRGVPPYDDEDTIYVQRIDVSTSYVLRASISSYGHGNERTLLRDVKDFEVREEFILATVKDVGIQKAC